MVMALQPGWQDMRLQIWLSIMEGTGITNTYPYSRSRTTPRESQVLAIPPTMTHQHIRQVRHASTLPGAGLGCSCPVVTKLKIAPP